IALIIGSSLAYLVLLWPMKAELGRFRGVRKSGISIDFSLLRRFMGYGFPVIGWVLGVKVLDLSDRFIIELFRDSEEVGIYSASYTLVTMGVLFVATPLLSAALPLIVNTWEQGHHEKIQTLVSVFSRYYLLFAVPVVAFTIVFGREIVTVFLGEEFREGYKIIPFIILGSLVWNFSMYGHKGIKLLEKTRVMLFLVTICCAANIVLNLIFVPRYGYQGAAVTTLVSFGLYPVLVYFVTKRYLPWVIPWRSTFRIVFSVGLASAGWWGLRWALTGRVHVLLLLLISLAAGLIIYIGMLALTRELRDYEWRLIAMRRRS
ncbi:MAG: polysaccharide biosynthesis C-terminal domain-containing protein, partial [Candidatus Latescibacterota bacterium]